MTPPATDLPTLTVVLADSPQRLLVAIACWHGLPATSRSPKAELAAGLASHLAGPGRLDELVARLPAEGHAALRALADRGGRMPLPAFERLAGPVPPFHPWRPGAPRRPWEQPESVGDVLRWAGLVYLRPGVAGGLEVVLPAEVLAVLAPAEQAAAGAAALPAPGAGTGFMRDLAVFLASLVVEDARLLRDRWLSLRTMHAVARRFDPPEEVGEARSELAVPRLCFVHFVAEALGLVDRADGCLVPSAMALAWLDQPTEVRWRSAWAAIRGAEPADLARWRRYRLPGGALPQPGALVDAVVAELAAGPPGAGCTAGAVALRLERTVGADWPWWMAEELDVAEEAAALLAGPLAELGLVHARPGSHPATWALTARGAWLLGCPGGMAPDPEEAPLVLDGELTLALPPGLRPWAVLALAPWCEWSGDGPAALRLSPESIARALSRSPALTPEDVVAGVVGALARGAEPAPSEDQVAAIRRWCRRVSLATLQSALVLSVADPADRSRAVAALAPEGMVERVLSDDLVMLRAANRVAVARSLRKAGMTVRGAAGAPSSAAQADIAVWRAVAALVLEAVARRWSVCPPPPPSALAASLAGLPAGGYAAAQAAADDVLHRLAAAMDVPAPGLPADTQAMLADVEAAIAAGDEVVLRYWQPGRGEWTERTVRPLRITWLDDAPALVAHCALRGAERTFRLDRIVGWRVLGLPGAGGMGPAR